MTTPERVTATRTCTWIGTEYDHWSNTLCWRDGVVPKSGDIIEVQRGRHLSGGRFTGIVRLIMNEGAIVDYTEFLSTPPLDDSIQSVFSFPDNDTSYVKIIGTAVDDMVNHCLFDFEERP